MSCNVLNAYQDRRLAPGEARAFDAHLLRCASCQAAVARWSAVQGTLTELASSSAGSSPTPAQTTRLLRLAATRDASPRRTALFVHRGFALAATVMLVGTGLILWRMAQDRGAPATQHAVAPSDDLAGAVIFYGGADAPARTSPIPLGQLIPVPSEGRAEVRLGGDRVSLAADCRFLVSSVRGDRVRVSQQQGTARYAIEPRKNGGEFIIESAGWTVTVVGTRFAVRRSATELDVSVVQGAVAVAGPSAQGRLLTAGESFTFITAAPPQNAGTPVHGESDGLVEQHERRSEKRSAEPRETEQLPITTPNEPEDRFSTWRRMIADGRHGEAAALLEATVAEEPGNIEAWSLLGDCRRKAGDAQQAVAAYVEVMTRGSGKAQSRARFLAGVVLADQLGDHRTAISVFEAYLGTAPPTDPLADAVKLRLSISKAAMGQKQEACDILRSIAAGTGKSTVADKARELLSGGCDESKQAASGTGSPEL